MLTIQRLQECLQYSPDTGFFTWRIVRNRSAPVGTPAGCYNNYGYLCIKLDQKKYLVHRLAWFYTHGVWPVCTIDHVDGCKTNNQLKNLREATPAQQGQNIKKAKKHNKTGFLGVSKKREKWTSEVKIDGKRVRLGVFSTPEAAHEAYLSAKRAGHPFNTI
jgi:hypothetical protein